MRRTQALLSLSVFCLVGVMLGCEGPLSVTDRSEPVSQTKDPASQPGITTPGINTPGKDNVPGKVDPDTPSLINPDGTPKTAQEIRIQTLEVCRTRTTVSPARTPLKRLSRREYDRSVAQLLKTDKTPSVDFVADEKIASFYGNTQAPITESMVVRYQDAAQALAKEAVDARLDELAPCDGDSAKQEGCAKAFISNFGARLMRHPLEESTQDALFKVYELGSSQGDYKTGIQLVLESMLQSPAFLYHVEVGNEQGELDHFEIAARLSYMITGQAPDDKLWEAAQQNLLKDTDERQRQARRLLQTEAAKDTLINFYTQWSHLKGLDEITKDTELFPEFDDELRTSMRRETELVIKDVMLQGDGTFNSLLSTDYSFVNAPLAAIYGIPFKGEDPSEFIRVDLPKNERFGILTHAGLLALHANANQSSPIFRGLFVSEEFLCLEPPPTPAGIEVQAPDPDPNLTTKERFALHSSDPSCEGCHRFMDPIGLSFESYDAIGRHRTKEGDKPVDASGTIYSTSPRYKDIQFTGVGELTDVLKDDDRVTTCMSTQVFRYAFGRLERRGDQCQVAALEDAWDKSKGDLREVLVALVAAPDFITRAQITQEN